MNRQAGNQSHCVVVLVIHKLFDQITTEGHNALLAANGGGQLAKDPVLPML